MCVDRSHCALWVMEMQYQWRGRVKWLLLSALFSASLSSLYQPWVFLSLSLFVVFSVMYETPSLTTTKKQKICMCFFCVIKINVWHEISMWSSNKRCTKNKKTLALLPYFYLKTLRRVISSVEIHFNHNLSGNFFLLHRILRHFILLLFLIFFIFL
jgi:hypothetical protein